MRMFGRIDSETTGALKLGVGKAYGEPAAEHMARRTVGVVQIYSKQARTCDRLTTHCAEKTRPGKKNRL